MKDRLTSCCSYGKQYLETEAALAAGHSKTGGGWATMSGTSMATPHVAGVAALWVEKLRNQGALTVPGILLSELKANATRQSLWDTDVNSIGVGMVQSPE